MQANVILAKELALRNDFICMSRLHCTYLYLTNFIKFHKL